MMLDALFEQGQGILGWRKFRIQNSGIETEHFFIEKLVLLFYGTISFYKASKIKYVKTQLPHLNGVC